jgi:hypothetical protein
MHTSQGWWQHQSVCHISQLSHKSKWTDVTWWQLAFDPKSLNTSRRRDTKLHTVASFEFKWSVSLVGIAFLSRLGSFQIGLDAMDYLLGLSDKVGTKDRPLARLNLVQRCTTSMTIQIFKGCHFETLLTTTAVRDLRQW